MATAARNQPLQFVVKIAARCNLNCTYCYIYNKGDTSWRGREPFMSDHIFDITLQRIRNHCLRSGQSAVKLIFHGGEPCLIGSERFADLCTRVRTILADVAHVELSMQTNGTLLDQSWVKVIRDFEIEVGISIDGPPEVNDTLRVDHRGRGSYDAMIRGVNLLRKANLPLDFLTVIQFGTDGSMVHRHLLELGATSVNYLLPDFTHDTVDEIHDRYGPTPCAEFLLPILYDWWTNGSLNVKVGIFWHMSRLILGGPSIVDMFGNFPFGIVFVETDGAIEGLDVLRACQPGITATSLNVMSADFTAIAEVSDLYRAAIFDGMPLPSGCRQCPERTTCAGGYLPHRYSAGSGFDNPSVWCADILLIFERLRELLGVSTEETILRRQALTEMATTEE